VTAKALRAAPSYATYASDDLARAAWYGLTAGQRGLLESMARAYWVDGGLPREPRLLPLACRLDPSEVEQVLADAVLAHFEADAEGRLHHVELRRQLQNIAITREKQSEGGKVGANITNAIRGAKRKPKPDAASHRVTSVGAGPLASTPAGQVRVPERTEMKELNCNSSLGKRDKDSVPDPWVADYEQSEQTTAADYKRATGR
jgi:hypothetical protein